MNKINGTSKLVRPKFAPGMLLQHEDLELLNTYTRNLSRIIFGSLFGCGVVCGLVVKPETKCGQLVVTIGSGLAIACSGDPISVPKDETLTADEKCDPEIGDQFWVVLCGTVKSCAPRTSMCSSEDDESPAVATREIEGYEIRLVKTRPECACGCDEIDYEPPVTDCQCADPDLKCYERHYKAECGCGCGDCSDCECKCILLAKIDRVNGTDEWDADHSVRRFIRPVLMQDPQIKLDFDKRAERNQVAMMKGPAAPTVPVKSKAIPKITKSGLSATKPTK